ncbi:MAG: GNAT family N-acetyltransferase [Lachnospiraceae bacterium]|nr:GNAT family N-acetyltransferase [Lachnospiraceae bacterium]
MSESKAEIRLQERFEAQSDKQSETKSRKPSEVQSDKQSKEQSALQFDDHLVVQSNDETGKSYEVCISCIMIVFSTMVSTEQKNRLKENLSGIETVKIHELPEAFLQRTNIDLMEIDFQLHEKQPDPLCNDDDATMKTLFCITDIPDVCRLAQEKGIPSLLYLHDGNKEESMSQIPYAITDFEGIDYAYLCNVYKRFYHIPWTILETRRCVLREMTEDDLDALYEVYRDPEVSKYTENLYEDREKERTYIRDYIEQVYRFCGLGIWVIVLKETNTIIGRAGLAWRDGYDTPEIGFVIAKDYQRQGYAFEVCASILHYCKEMDLRSIRVLYQKENIASDRLCEKLGFEVKREFEADGKRMIDAVLEIV